MRLWFSMKIGGNIINHKPRGPQINKIGSRVVKILWIVVSLSTESMWRGDVLSSPLGSNSSVHILFLVLFLHIYFWWLLMWSPLDSCDLHQHYYTWACGLWEGQGLSSTKSTTVTRQFCHLLLFSDIHQLISDIKQWNIMILYVLYNQRTWLLKEIIYW